MSSSNTNARFARSDADLSGLEAQAKGTGVDVHSVNSTTNLIHRDALGRAKQLPQDKWSPHGWYLDPNNAKLAELLKVQGTHNMHSKLPWVIQMAASGYESDGKGVLHIRGGQYALACLALPWLVS